MSNIGVPAKDAVRIRAYEYLINKSHKTGFKSTLYEEKIPGSLVEELSSVGILKQGIDANASERYQVTEFGYNQMSAYLKINNYSDQIEELLIKYKYQTDI